MSKIEEALNKAKKSREKGLTAYKGNLKASDISELVSPDTMGGEVLRKSAAQDIALMDSGDELNDDSLSELKVIYSGMQDNKIANTYRDLRTKLIQKNKGKNFIIMVTTCNAGEDTALTSLNISAAFSFDESKTSLLIDCNLNNPKLDDLLKMNADAGLTDYLENESIEVNKIVHKTGIKRLKVIPAGTSRETATEYFTSLRMRKLMSDLLHRYDDRYIFIDAAPITESADTRILVDLCDYVILVVPYGVTTKGKIEEAKEAIDKDKMLGVVFNNVPKIPKFRMPKVFSF
ncbi:MAG: polysaccharide biosynthesis protein [endosymbiont of Galathealinum brachiosum]|uniref:Polysaccharide biosynthesis protein n=1 Tax=endosymbiont of Galathealinum brachiosum TaxID=2200906 RepID=A0A370DFR0_9GAMM|nr:MAG: polysaccharide biosynthesis protein [endosymbiont of Galathealinum brachiosum]